MHEDRHPFYVIGAFRRREALGHACYCGRGADALVVAISGGAIAVLAVCRQHALRVNAIGVTCNAMLAARSSTLRAVDRTPTGGG